MIKKVNLEDANAFYCLGSLLNDKFKKLYNLEKILNQNYSHVYGYYLEDKLVAFLHIEKSYDEISIINIVVKEELQGKSIATELLTKLFKTFPLVTKYILEVKESNIKAINLYNKFGFVTANTRKNYYDQEDGYLMVKEVKK